MSLRESSIEAGVVEVVKAAKAMRQGHISLIPKPDFAVTDKDGIPRLGVDDVVRVALDALVAHLEAHADEWVEVYPGLGTSIEALEVRQLLAVLGGGD